MHILHGRSKFFCTLYSLAFRAFHTIQQLFMIFLSDTILIGTFYSVMVKGKETLLVFIAKKKVFYILGKNNSKPKITLINCKQHQSLYD
jgi:hypothetical protein